MFSCGFLRICSAFPWNSAMSKAGFSSLQEKPSSYFSGVNTGNTLEGEQKKCLQNGNFSFLCPLQVFPGPFGKARNQTLLGVIRLMVNYPTHIRFSWCGGIKFGIVLSSYEQGLILCLKVGVCRVAATPCPAPVVGCWVFLKFLFNWDSLQKSFGFITAFWAWFL